MNQLPAAWVSFLAASASRILGRDDLSGDALARAVADVSRAYTRERDRMHALDDAGSLAARLRFFLPRDVMKIVPPVRELAWARAVPSRAVLRVLDVGAGLGASTLGLLVALGGGETGRSDMIAEDSGGGGRVGVKRLEVLAVDPARRALRVFEQLARELERSSVRETCPALGLVTRAAAIESAVATIEGPFDVIVVGQTLNELYATLSETAAIEGRASLVEALGRLLVDDGAMVIVEPALRVTSRALHAVRDRVLGPSAELRAGRPDKVLSVFAPCVRQGPCPMLATERDWCHEDAPIALPPSLRAIASAAGLRHEGLSFSYLTLRKDGRSLRSAASSHGLLGPGALLARVVGDPRRTKGKREVFTCADEGHLRLVELDRDVATESAIAGMGRGDLVVLDGPVDVARPRLGTGVSGRRARPSDA